ncbi:MAG: serine/threonine-protein kinase, partial [Planctomycetota bacterium]
MAKENGNNDPLVPKTKREEETPPAGEAATLPPASAFEGAVTAHLRSKTGIRGEISLPSEDLREETPAGPASKGRYGVLGEIARGGMGAIVKLVDNDIRRPVAMKVILGEGVKERVERFVEEAQVTGQLEHPNIVPVHELGLDPDGKVYFTMKLVKGESLDAIIDALADKDPEVVRNYPLSHLLQIFLKVCDAIAFAHSKGVIHRDLKPENVMVGRFGEVLVMDWGLALGARQGEGAGGHGGGGTGRDGPLREGGGEDTVGGGDGDAVVHAAGAGIGKGGADRRAFGRLRAGGDAVQDPDARGAVYGVPCDGGADEGGHVRVQGAAGEESVEPDPEGAAVD